MRFSSPLVRRNADARRWNLPTCHSSRAKRGIVSAGMARRQWDEDPAYRRRAQEAIALGELQDPNSVADAFAFLCSPMASYMTGSPLLVDGGCALGSP